MSRFQVWKGIENDVPVGFLDDFLMSVPKDGAQRIEAALASHQPVMAPIQRGQELGTLTLSIDGRLLGEYPVVALQDVEVAGFFGRLWDALRLWIKSL
jgi:D-alanyl-D-alanine carboxypeptidase (penicillin-binding protein 5/6)